MKKIKQTIGIVFLVMIMIVAVEMVSASVPSGGTLATGNNSTASSSVSSGSSNAAGGYVTEINITGNNQQTANWQGFWGNVSAGTIYLNDSSGNSMYNWATVVTNGGFVYATTKSTAPSWSSVTAISAATLDGGSYWNFGSKSDNISNTYTSTRDITIASYTVSGAINTTVNTYFNNSAVSDGSSASRAGVIWVGEINNDKTNFKSTSSDYELLVPVVAGDSYKFYIEIS
ncbi:MAG: hypothetical protein OIN87_03865 [Candidatus Methanoperedens sp.]|nr:hypothetical protein [Candidatus Methanoperedens sp.]